MVSGTFVVLLLWVYRRDYHIKVESDKPEQVEKWERTLIIVH